MGGTFYISPTHSRLRNGQVHYYGKYQIQYPTRIPDLLALATCCRCDPDLIIAQCLSPSFSSLHQVNIYIFQK